VDLAQLDRAFRRWWTCVLDNDTGLLKRTVAALGRPAWEVTSEDVDRAVGELAVAGRSASTRREYVQIFKGFHRFLQTRNAAEIDAGFGGARTEARR
jgi:integrase/recombinase XerD